MRKIGFVQITEYDISARDFDQFQVLRRAVVVNSHLVGNCDGLRQIGERPVISAPDILLRDRVASHPNPFPDTKDVELNVVKHDENQTNMIAGVARPAHHRQ